MQHVTVFFRYDDYSANSPLAVDRGLISALHKSGLCATFAVIPAVTEGRYHEPGQRGVLPLGPEKVALLQEAVRNGTVDVALHGWDHRTISTSPAGHSEFVGLPLAEQIDKLRRGRETLQQAAGVTTTVFVPPWNRYDRNTIAALTGLGFAAISANRYGPGYDGAMKFVPITADMAELRQAIAFARDSGDPDPIVGVLLHPYDFKESGDARGRIEWAALDTELSWLAAQPGITVMSVSELASTNTTLGPPRYRANQPWRFESITPSFVRTTEATPFLQSQGLARRAKATRALLSIVTYVAAAVLGFAAARVLLTALPWPGVAAAGKWLAVIFLLGLIVRATSRRELHFRMMLGMAILAGIIISGDWLPQ